MLIVGYIYLHFRRHQQAWRPPSRVLLVFLPRCLWLPQTQQLRLRLEQAQTTQLFTTAWSWSISLGTSGLWRSWTPPLWEHCLCLPRLTSRRWSREEWRAAPSRLFWPVSEVMTRTVRVKSKQTVRWTWNINTEHLLFCLLCTCTIENYLFLDENQTTYLISGQVKFESVVFCLVFLKLLLLFSYFWRH